MRYDFTNIIDVLYIKSNLTKVEGGILQLDKIILGDPIFNWISLLIE